MTLCEASALGPGEGRVVRAGRHEIALFNVDGEYHALDNACPHEGGPLGEGIVAGGTVTCPWHFAEFEIASGASLDPIAPCDVETYPVIVEDGMVKVDLA